MKKKKNIRFIVQERRVLHQHIQNTQTYTPSLSLFNIIIWVLVKKLRNVNEVIIINISIKIFHQFVDGKAILNLRLFFFFFLTMSVVVVADTAATAAADALALVISGTVTESTIFFVNFFLL